MRGSPWKEGTLETVTKKKQTVLHHMEIKGKKGHAKGIGTKPRNGTRAVVAGGDGPPGYQATRGGIRGRISSRLLQGEKHPLWER